MDMKINNEKLKQLRELKAWSQSHLATVSGVSLRTIQRIEKTGIASPETVKAICATFDLTVQDILQTNNQTDGIGPTFTAVVRYRIANMDKKGTIIAFALSFLISLVLSLYIVN
ncbi:helix-turn-helix transcriptional regulator [Pseudoalteromonas sp. T1lg65]|uniref:helix-turn-helix transcriptional regulator n=1 Tax=Pseudoalteromonas sp. T1lg65 TaxID=2077101 RepID=UPI003F79674A